MAAQVCFTPATHQEARAGFLVPDAGLAQPWLLWHLGEGTSAWQSFLSAPPSLTNRLPLSDARPQLPGNGVCLWRTSSQSVVSQGNVPFVK